MNFKIAGGYRDDGFVFVNRMLFFTESCHYHMWPQRPLLPLLSKFYIHCIVKIRLESTFFIFPFSGVLHISDDLEIVA